MMNTNSVKVTLNSCKKKEEFWRFTVRERGGGIKHREYVWRLNCFTSIIKIPATRCLWAKTLSWLTLSSYLQYYCSHNGNNICLLWHTEQLACEAPEETVNFPIFSSATENRRPAHVLHLYRCIAHFKIVTWFCFTFSKNIDEARISLWKNSISLLYTVIVLLIYKIFRRIVEKLS